MNSLEVSSLNKTFISQGKKNYALKNINLNIKEGSFFGFLGPNGAGKSTFINILSSLVKKDSGQIKVCGIDFDQNEDKAKNLLGIVPQEIHLDPFFSIEEMLEIYAGYFGIPKQKMVTSKIISALGLTRQRKLTPRKLSGGMKRRLLIAKALINDPKIVILDEPTAGVDVDLREQLWEYITKLNTEFGKTIILTTHYLEEVEKLCDSLAILDKGKIIISDKKKNLKKIFGYKRIVLELDKVTKTLQNHLSKLGKLEVFDNKIIISYSEDKFSYGDLIKVIGENKVKLINLQLEESSIEEVFKKILKTERK